MIYIVSGTYRSGTTLMMSALIAGGIEGRYKDKPAVESRLMAQHGANYNPGPYYEHGFSEWDENHPEGTVTKIFHNNVGDVVERSKVWNQFEYTIIFMVRDPHESAKSFMRFVGKDKDYTGRFNRAYERTLPRLSGYDNVTLIPIDFNEAINNPQGAAETLRDKFEFDVDKFVTNINSGTSIRVKK